MASLQPQSDVGALWTQALDDYEKTTEVDMRRHLHNESDISSIIAHQQRQLANFEKFRHNKGKLDRFRSMISKSVDVVRSFTAIANDIVCIAFPPASAVLTAFTLVLTASDRVSADYDSIESFFSVVQAFLLRLSLLEGRFPPQEVIQKSLIQVFSSLLVLSGTAHAYRAKGRISRWTRNLVDRNDVELSSAFDKLNSDLSHLESAVILQTLRTTMEISAQTNSTKADIHDIHEMVKGSSYITLQLRDSSEQMLSIVSQIRTEVRRGFQRSNDATNTRVELPRDSVNIRKGPESSQAKVNKSKERIMNAGASRPMNFERLKREILANAAESSVGYRFADIKSSHVRNIFGWVEQDPAFQNISNAESSLLWVSGVAGMGKSTISLAMFQCLSKKFSLDPTTSVAWFCFDEELPEMQSIDNMLRHCSMQAAMDNDDYCRETIEALRRSGPLETDEDAWRHLIESRYKVGSDRRLILILDGIDEVSDKDFTKIIATLRRQKAHRCSVQVIFTSGPEEQKDVSVLEAECIELTRDKIMGDMYKYASAKMRTLTKLRKLRPKVQRNIVRKVMHKADSFLYVDHTFRKLNVLGREGPILKAIESLADSTTDIYRAMLAECLEDRTPEEHELLRKLFAWLAYTKVKFSVAEINWLVAALKTNKAISIEDEIEGKLSRLLRIHGDRAGNEQDTSSADEGRTESITDADSESEDEGLEVANNFLLFQERSLKAYFCQPLKDSPDGLRCSAIEAHVIIIRACSVILATPSSKYGLTGQALEIYAVNWLLYHLHEISSEKDKLSSDLAKTVIECIYNVFTDQEALKSWEEHTPADASILSGGGLTQDETIDMLSAWAQLALKFVSDPLPDAMIDWYRPIAQEPLRIFIGLARAHVANWYAAMSQEEAFFAFRSAHRAIQEGRDQLEVKQNPDLYDYLAGFTAGDDEAFTEDSFQMVADCFSDIGKTASSYKGIGMAMKYRDLYGPAIDQLNKGLSDATVDGVEKFDLLGSKGQGLLELAQSEENEEARRRHLEESFSVYEQANEIYRGVKDPHWQVGWDLQNMACAAALLGKYDDALRIFTEALATKEYIYPYIVTKIFEAFKNAEQYSMVIEVLKRMTRKTAAVYLLVERDEVVQEAAARSKQGQFLLEVYNRAQKVVEATTWSHGLKDDHSARLHSNVAMFQRHALGLVDQAKSVLHDMIDSSRTPAWRVLEACNLLTDILFEEFRTSNVPSVKQAALVNAKQLLIKPKEVLPKYYNAEESHMTISIALMLKRTGPAQEFQDRLDDAFKNCTKQLRDDTGTNDASALRRLARVLSCIPGFAEDASIALTCQFYIVDDDVHKMDLVKRQDSMVEPTKPALEPEGSGTLENSAPQQPTEIQQSPVDLEQSTHAPFSDQEATESALGSDDSTANKTASNSDKKIDTDIVVPPNADKGIEEGLLLDNEGCFCNICTKFMWNLSHGAVYYCVYCIDVDICEDCFYKKLLRDKGELEQDWRVVCPKGHRHVKAPVEGWRGVKNGVMRIGEREVVFKKWLQGLENRWREYWEGFWTETDDV